MSMRFLSVVLFSGAVLVAPAQTPFWIYRAEAPDPAIGISPQGASAGLSRTLFDDVVIPGGYQGQWVETIGVHVINTAAVDATFQLELRFWQASSTSNTTMSGVLGPQGYMAGSSWARLAPFRLESGNRVAIETTLAPQSVVLSGNRFWMGAAFSGASADGSTLPNSSDQASSMAFLSGNLVSGAGDPDAFQSVAPEPFATNNNPTLALLTQTRPAFQVAVPGQDVRFKISLADVSPAMAVPRHISAELRTHSNLFATVTNSLSQPTAALSSVLTGPATLPTTSTGPLQLVLDGLTFLRRVVTVNMPNPNVYPALEIDLGTITLQNGDVDGSGEVDAADIDAVIADFGDTTSAASDVDVTGEVDAADIDTVIMNFGAFDE